LHYVDILAGEKMYLTHHQTREGPQWALDGQALPKSFSLNLLLEIRQNRQADFLRSVPTAGALSGALLPPVEPLHEIWACGVTYLRSREAREAESQARNVYEKVYDAERPELFFKAIGWRAVGHQQPIRIRKDSRWNVPEPELTLVINCHREIVGYCVGNDVSSRDIEGENPLYLPQAKVYKGSCAVGPGIRLATASELRDLLIQLSILRNEEAVFQGETRSSQMKRSLEELAECLTREMDFPQGVFLLTGTGIVPPEDFSLQTGDIVRIAIDSLVLENRLEE
jgi:2-dehydro-3-deoxy-D-arabinonate dehydratase